MSIITGPSPDDMLVVGVNHAVSGWLGVIVLVVLASSLLGRCLTSKES